MDFNEIIEQLKTFEDSEEFENYVSGLMNNDRVSKYLTNTDDGKLFMQKKMDSHFSKGLETWKKNNLDNLVNAKVKELYPDADPKDIELAAIKAELEKVKAESQRKDLTNQALKIANEKGLPVNLVRYFVGTDEKTTADNMDEYETTFKTVLSEAVENRLKRDSHVPPIGETEDIDGVTAAFMKLNPGLKLNI